MKSALNFQKKKKKEAELKVYTLHLAKKCRFQPFQCVFQYYKYMIISPLAFMVTFEQI